MVKLKPKTSAKTQKQCPLCQGDTLIEGHLDEIYRYRQGLYHLILFDVPIQAFCEQCEYKIVGEKATSAVNQLVKELDLLAFQLLEVTP